MSYEHSVLGWMARRGFWGRLSVAMACGGLLTLGHPPVFLPFSAFIALPILVWLSLAQTTGWRTTMVWWGAGLGYFATGMHWIVNPFLVSAHDTLSLALMSGAGVLGVLGLSAGLGLFWAVAGWLAWRLSPPGPIWHAVTLAATLSAVEYARAHVLTGLPWAMPGYVWVDTPVMQAASWAGPFGLTLITLLSGGILLPAAMRRQWLLAGLAVAFLAGLWGGGHVRLQATAIYAPDAPTIRIVQPNAPQHQKWDPRYRDIFYRRLIDATAKPGTPDLVIWPEMAVTFLIEEHDEPRAEIAAAARGAPVVLGGLHRVPQPAAGVVTNALFTILPGGQVGHRYDKHHLVPFGEYMPLQNVLSLIGLKQFTQGGFVEGPGPANVAIDGLPAFSALICYEVIFPFAVVPDERPAWLVQITNDAWFGNFAGPQQHYAQARMRAVEQGLPLARAANTGISAIVDAHGREIISVGLNEYNFIDHKLPSPLPPTIYSRIGDWPVVILIASLIIICGLRRFTARRH